MPQSRDLFLAHSANPRGRSEPLARHLQRVAELAARFARPLGAAAEAHLAGLLHDLGKYGELFQRRLQGRERGVDHWSAGAWVALTCYHLGAAGAAIAGHHLGLPCMSTQELQGLDPSRPHHPRGLRYSESDWRLLLRRLEVDGITLPPPAGGAVSIYRQHHRREAADMLNLRMLFSALVDADFLATEEHFLGPRPAGPKLEAARDLGLLEEHLAELEAACRAQPEVAAMRRDLQAACRTAAAQPPGLFTLTAPTGAGKTLAMLGFALEHARRHGLRRVVVVIPYLSIIEQTVAVYRRVLGRGRGGGELEAYLIEDHSLAGTHPRQRVGADAQEEGPPLARLLAQNWDAPLVVTTSVQMLESLFAHRPGPCRKLHRLAASVILFDEVQTLPARLAVVTLATLAHLSRRFGASVVFSTATQPAFDHLSPAVEAWCGHRWRPREIVPPELGLFSRRRRVQVHWPRQDERLDWRELAERLAEERQVLCIVNLKAHARRLYQELESLAGEEGLYHLSTGMCPGHRRQTLEEVSRRLEAGRPCRLVSTQCVEAGVDLDFPVVWRAWGPLEALAQAAGRCNRNGHLAQGGLRVFHPATERSPYPDGAYRQAADVAQGLLARLGPQGLDLDHPETFRRYYQELYDLNRLRKRPERPQEESLEAALGRHDFPQVARHYALIERGEGIEVLVPWDQEAFPELLQEVRERGLSRGWMRRAREHSVSLFRNQARGALGGWLEALPLPRMRGGGPRAYSREWFACLQPDYYHPRLGLIPPEEDTALLVV